MKQMIEDNGSLKLIFIRHAKPDYNDCGDRDCSDGDLDETGLAQCAALGEHYKDIHLDACFSSSLLRAFRTAAAICDAKPEKPLIEICPELIEGGTTPGYYGCSEEYLQKYYPNAKCATPNSSVLKNTTSAAPLTRKTSSGRRRPSPTLKTVSLTAKPSQLHAIISSANI